MNASPLIEHALYKASLLHQGQHRRGRHHYPVLTHVVMVGLIISEYTDDEEVQAAGILHDTIEDTDYTFEAMKRDFGDRITQLVYSVTEPHLTGPGAWRDKRQAYLNNLIQGPDEALVVSAADKIHNFRSILAEYDEAGEEFRASFGGTKEDREWFANEICQIFETRLDTSMFKDFSRVYADYKQFLAQYG